MVRAETTCYHDKCRIEADFRPDRKDRAMPSGVPSRGTFPSLKAIVASLAKSRAFPLIVAALAVLLASPALRAGLILDDFYHRAVLRPGLPYRDLLGPPAEMFRFFRGDPGGPAGSWISGSSRGGPTRL